MNDIKSPLISVVIPTYNHALYLGRALQSLLDQTYTNWEAIVVDNHSTDNTDEVIARFVDPRINYLKINNNGVIAASRNLGIREARGEWIAFLDSDDWWTTDKLEVCFNCINDQVDFIYHDLEIVADKPRRFSRKCIKSRQVKPSVLLDLLMNNAIANSSVVVRKKLLQQIGGINENVKMIAAEDYNTWLKIATLTDKFLYLSRKLGYYFIHNQAISQKDMSIPTRYAVSEFVPDLSELQKIKIEVNIRYIRSRFNYLSGNCIEAKPDLLFCIKFGDWVVRLKAIFMLFGGYIFRRY